MPKVTIVIPCYNEARRLDRGEFLRLARSLDGLDLLLVDDGSTDGTRPLLDALAAATPAIRVHALPANRGKAEAVRAGLRQALAAGAEVVGYADADLATPVDELLRLARTALESSASVVLGSRVRLLGARIERRAARHYLGRVFATVASVALRLPVYDTQCGAKLFRRSPSLDAALASPFGSRWAFDVELIGRLSRGGPGAPPVPREAFLEVPLQAWRDVAGSKLGLRGALRAGIDLLRLLLRSRLGG